MWTNENQWFFCVVLIHAGSFRHRSKVDLGGRHDLRDVFGYHGVVLETLQRGSGFFLLQGTVGGFGDGRGALEVIGGRLQAGGCRVL